MGEERAALGGGRHRARAVEGAGGQAAGLGHRRRRLLLLRLGLLGLLAAHGAVQAVRRARHVVARAGGGRRRSCLSRRERGREERGQKRWTEKYEGEDEVGTEV